MTAFTASNLREYISGESKRVVVTLTGAPAYTYTPQAITGRTVRVIACKAVDHTGDAVTATVSAGVITVDAAGTTPTIYTLEHDYS